MPALVLVLGMCVQGAGTASATTSYGVKSWGYNHSGQLGIGSNDNSNVPVDVTGLTNVRAVAAGHDHSLALLKNGKVKAWGYNFEGQLGDGNYDDSNVPVPVSGLSGVKAIDAGYQHSLALLKDGTVMAWGDNTYGQLGNGTDNNYSNVPVAVSGLTNVVAIGAGLDHSVALLADGTVMAWGLNEHGELGVGSEDQFHVDEPVAVHDLSGVTAIDAGADHNIALLSDHTVVTWGDDEEAQLGNGGSGPDSTLPIPVSGLSGVKAIAAGDFHNLVLLRNGKVKAWGYNAMGQLGHGRTKPNGVPVTVRGLSGVAALAGGEALSLALLNDGTVRAWGDNLRGELGDGTNTRSNVSVVVSGLTGVAGIAAGSEHALAVA